jgi:hypothetical protein
LEYINDHGCPGHQLGLDFTLCGLSAPTAATNVPGRTSSRPKKGVCEDVQVTIASLTKFFYADHQWQ